MTNRSPHKNRSSIAIDWLSNLSVHPLFLGSPGDEIGKTNSDPTVLSMQRKYPVARVLELPTCPSLPFRVMSMQDVRVEALLNIICIINLQPLMLQLLPISLIAKVQIQLPEFFCEGTMRPLSDFRSL